MEDVIPEFEILKDLGVHMNSCANWSTNVMNVTKNSRQKKWGGSSEAFTSETVNS